MKRIFALFLICLSFTECKISDDTPSGVIRIFHKAVLKEDLETFIEYTTFTAGNPDFWLARTYEALSEAGRIKKITETINGDNAVVTVTFKKIAFEFPLKKEDGKWKVPFYSPFGEYD